MFGIDSFFHFLELFRNFLRNVINLSSESLAIFTSLFLLDWRGFLTHLIIHQFLRQFFRKFFYRDEAFGPEALH